MIKDITPITPEYMKHRLKEQEEYYKEEIERLQNKNEELLTLYTTEREVKEDYKSIIKEVREYITSYESIETINQVEHSKNNKGLDRDTMIEMINRHLKVHDKILEILDKVGDIK